MEKLSVEQSKQYQMEMLAYIDRICRQNDIPYSLGYGSLIGAIRHHGYIPWDDDVDLFMEYAQYVRFLDIVKKDGSYTLLTPDSKDYGYYYAKICHPETTCVCEDGYKHNENNGVFIDIFPAVVNQFNKSKKLQRYEKYLLASLEKGLFAFVSTAGWVRSVARIPYLLLCKMVGRTYWSRKIKKLLETDYKRYKEQGNTPWEGVAYSALLETVDCPFEDLTLTVFAQYHNLLTSLYGDYMQLPPEEKRCMPHSTEVMYRK